MAGLYGTQRWRKRALYQHRAVVCDVFETGIDHGSNCCRSHPTAKNNTELFWNGQLQSLCERHHNSTKQRFEKTGRRSNACDINGKPIDLI
jgi:hypothetical protein